MKLIFCLQIQTKVFSKLVVSLWVCIARHAQNTQYNKFVISLQYLKKEMSDEIDFLHADKYEKLIKLQIDTMILMGMAKHSQSFQNSKFAMHL